MKKANKKVRLKIPKNNDIKLFLFQGSSVLLLPLMLEWKMVIYLTYTHILWAFLSLGLLLVRGSMQLSQKDWRSIKLLKILPHLVDTLLILSGVIMLVMFNYGLPIWIIIKILLLVGYIVFSAKYFSKKNPSSTPLFFFLALISLIATILLGYFH